MSNAEVFHELQAIFRRAAQAHHEAFIATGGVDPEWASWYADYVQTQLDELLGVDLTRERVVDLLLRADADHQRVAPGRDWATFYGEYFLDEVTG